MSQTCKKQKSSNEYSHPLIRTIQGWIQEDHTRIIPSYQPIIPNSENRISAKIARCTYMGNTLHKEIGIAVAPFNEGLETLKEVINEGSCGHCASKITPFCRLENHTSRKCYFCGKTTEVSSGSDQYQTHYGYRALQESSQLPKSVNIDKKRASQHLYQASIHKSIFNVVSALSDEDLEIGFILFDNEYAMFINPHNMQVSKVRLSSQDLVDWSSIPLNLDQLFIKVGQNFEELYQLVNYLLYEAYFVKTTVLAQLCQIIAQSISKDIQLEYFITAVGKRQQQNQRSNMNPLANILNNYKTTLHKQIYKEIVQVQTTTRLTVLPNSHFYIIPHNLTYRQALQSCGFAVAKIYSTKEIKGIQNELYYDLFENIKKQLFNNIDIEVWTQKGIQLEMREHQIFTGYGNITVTKEYTSEKINHYKINIKRADRSFNLFLLFKVNNPLNSTPLIQLRYCLSRNSRRQSYILNLTPIQLEIKQSDLQSYDDEVIFNHHMRRCLMEWKGQSYKQLKERLVQQYKDTVWMLRSNSDKQGISFPKNWKHYLLYSFILQQFIQTGKLNSYLIYQLTTSNLEVLSKHFYYRAYRIDEGRIKNIKYSPNIFQKYTILFIENGRQLYLVLGDASVQEIKEIFGHFDSIPILSRQFPELPDLSSNEVYRNAIEAIRNSHQHNFLPLKIIDQESYLFTELIEPYLYRKDEHLSFLRKIWRNT